MVARSFVVGDPLHPLQAGPPRSETRGGSVAGSLFAPPMDGGVAPLGLSCAHICTDEVEQFQSVVTVAGGGRCASVKHERPLRGKRLVVGKRGKVRTFSPGSRRRMMQAFNSVDARKVDGAFFVTLTSRPMPMPRFRACVRAWVERLRRHYKGRWSLFWRLELHESGAPHLHALLLWVDPMPHLRDDFRPWNDAAWADVCGSDVDGVPFAGSNSCRSEFMRHWGGAAVYCSLYCSKVTQDEFDGRHWGIVNREHLPVDLRVERVARAVGVLVQRAFLRLRRARGRRVWITSTAWERPADSPGRGPVWRPGDRGQWASIGESMRRGGRMADQLRGMGWRMRLSRPKFVRIVHEDVWASGSDQDGHGFRFECFGSEPVCRYPSSWNIGHDAAERILLWAKGEYLRRLEVEDGAADPC